MRIQISEKTRKALYALQGKSELPLTYKELIEQCVLGMTVMAEQGYLATNEDGDLGLCVGVAEGQLTDLDADSVTEENAPFLTKGELGDVNGRGKGVANGQGAVFRTLAFLGKPVRKTAGRGDAQKASER